MFKSDEYYMNLALEEAKKAFLEDEIPVGCVIVDNNSHEIVGKGHNQKEKSQDATNHAEILAIKEASKKLDSWRLENCTLYVTLEPCVMCGSAILQSRIGRVVFGAFEKESGAFGGKCDLTKIFDSKIIVQHSILEKECVEVLSKFFGKHRKN